METLHDQNLYLFIRRINDYDGFPFLNILAVDKSDIRTRL